MKITHQARRSSRPRPRPVVERLECRELLASVAGTLDPAFGGRGYAITQASNANSDEQSSAGVDGVFDLPDGKVEVAINQSESVGAPFTLISFSTTTTSLLLERFNADGTPDPTFGSGGQLTAPVAGTTESTLGAQGVFVGAIVMQPDGKLIVAGTKALSPIPDSSTTFVAFRLNLDGTLDTSYGTNGLAEYPTSAQSATNLGLTEVSAASLQPNGDLVLAGTSFNGVTDYPASVRLTPDGSIDPSFGTAGTASFTSSQISQINKVASLPDGGVILEGTLQPTIAFGLAAPEQVVLRLNANGSVDTTFGGASGTNGVVPLPQAPNNGANIDFTVAALAIQADNKIVLSTENLKSSGSIIIPFNEGLVRLNADGTLDTGYGQGGFVTAAVAGAMAIQGDGKVVVGGSINTLFQADGTPTRSVFAAERLNTDGSTDSSFGSPSTPGVALYSFGASVLTVEAVSLAIQADGNILLAGTTVKNSAPGAFYPSAFTGVARILGQAATTSLVLKPPPATPPASIAGDGESDLAVYVPSIGAFAYKASTNYSAVVIPFGLAGLGQTLPAVADYAGIGYSQIAAYLPALGEYAIRPAGYGPDLIFPFGMAGAGQSLPVPADYEGTGRADVAVYMPSIAAFGIKPSDGSTDRIVPFGLPGAGQSIPVPGDYDGDGKADLAVYMPSIGAFGLRPSSGGPDEIITMGLKGSGMSIPAPGDYDNSGHLELAVYIPSKGRLVYRPAKGGPNVIIPFGTAKSGEVPTPGDYSGLGYTNVGVYDPSTATFLYQIGGNEPNQILTIGEAGTGQSIPLTASPTVPSTASPSKTTSKTVSVKSVKSDLVTASAVEVPGGPLLTTSARRIAKTSVLQAKSRS